RCGKRVRSPSVGKGWAAGVGRCSVPRCLLYEMYREYCRHYDQNQVNPATFGKVQSSASGSCRGYHYDGIHIKKSSSFYTPHVNLWAQPDLYGALKKIHSCKSLEKDKFGTSLTEFRRFSSWEEELGKKHSYEMVALLADEYCSYCQDILQNMRNKELDKVSFVLSLQPEIIILMSLPDMSQLFKCYDRQLFKEMESILLHDFLEDVSIQYLKSVRLFSKNVSIWLVSALEDFPLLLRMLKIKEVTVFVKRIRRKTYLSNMVKTMRIVLNNNSRVSALKSDLNAVLSQEILDIPGNTLQKKFKHVDGMERDLELKCLNNLISLLDASTDIGVFLNSVSANLRTFVIQPSKSKEEFKQLAAKFQLGWNFLLTAVSKAMTLSHMDSFGSWHLFNLLLLEYVIHILQSHLEEEGDEGLSVIQQNSSSIQVVHKPAHLLDDFSVERPQVEVPEPAHVTLTQSQSDVNLSSVILKVLSCLVDTATGNKLLQVMLEDKITKSSVKLNLPVGKDALITLKDGQRFIIRTSDPQ
uniref:Regulatory factor X8 n=1 Tax=Crocodylus porosus TaxID=8502 RepID=A0A7M4F393_CROPO